MLVKNVMTTNVVTVLPEETVATASRLMARDNLGALAVCSRDGHLRGMLTDRDIVLRCVASGENPAELTVRQVMTRRLVTVSPEETTDQAASCMARQQVRRLPVEEEGKLVGMISLADLSREPQYRMEAAEALCNICNCVRK